MFEKIIFRNHLGEEIESGQGGFYVNSNDLRDYTWSYEEISDRIVGFKRGIVKKSIPIVILTENEEEAVFLKNRITTLSEKDVCNMEPGKIIINGCYMRGYIYESKKTKYYYNKRFLQSTLKFVSDEPQWITETTYSFFPGGGDTKYPYLDYSYDYDYDYMPDIIHTGYINTDHYAPCKYLLKIYGPAIDPAVTIGGLVRQVYTTLEAGQYLLIDGRDKTIKRVLNDGAVLSEFDNRRRGTKSIFEPIAPGSNEIIGSNTFGFDLTLFVERSEPEWR